MTLHEDLILTGKLDIEKSDKLYKEQEDVLQDKENISILSISKRFLEH